MKLPIGARAFVGFIFFVLWASFLVCPVLLYQEFGPMNWLPIAMFHSYIFIFYPLFGLVVLVSFYRPAVVFTDLYWRHIPFFGQLRFLVGFAVVAAVSFAISVWLLDTPPRSIWEMKSGVAAAAAGNAANCTETGTGCDSGALFNRLFAVRAASMSGKRTGMQPFARDCNPDALMELPAENLEARQCFLSGQKENAKDCCTKQAAFQSLVQADYADWHKKSLTGIAHAYLLPFKTFFIMIMIIIAIMLVGWQAKVQEHYRTFVPKMERGLLIGAIAMLFWPLMEYAYGQSAGVLFGNWGAGFNFKISILVLPWAVIIGLYFLRSQGFGILTQIGSVLGATLAALRYDEVTSFAERFMGSGAGYIELAVMAALALIAIIVVLVPGGLKPDPKTPAALEAGARYAQEAADAVAAGRDPLDGGFR